jgi:hypothetical protein
MPLDRTSVGWSMLYCCQAGGRPTCRVIQAADCSVRRAAGSVGQSSSGQSSSGSIKQWVNQAVGQSSSGSIKQWVNQAVGNQAVGQSSSGQSSSGSIKQWAIKQWVNQAVGNQALLEFLGRLLTSSMIQVNTNHTFFGVYMSIQSAISKLGSVTCGWCLPAVVVSGRGWSVAPVVTLSAVVNQR